MSKLISPERVEKIADILAEEFVERVLPPDPAHPDRNLYMSRSGSDLREGYREGFKEAWALRDEFNK